MRPDKIVALENDDYSRFASNAYAKSFLLMYSRFLGIDVSDYLGGLEEPAKVNVREYQYLENTPAVPTSRIRVGRTPGSRPPSVIPLLVLIMLFAVAGFGFYIFTQSQRLEFDKPRTPTVENPKGSDAALSLARTDTPELPTAAGLALAQPNLPSAPSGNAAASGPTANTLPPLPLPGMPIEQPASPSVSLPGAVHEVIVEPLKKTWVKIRKGSPDSEPIFEDFLYPNAPPLKLRGASFFVEVRDEGAVQIRKNGSPIAYQAPGISIQ